MRTHAHFATEAHSLMKAEPPHALPAQQTFFNQKKAGQIANVARRDGILHLFNLFSVLSVPSAALRLMGFAVRVPQIPCVKMAC
mmetsp:Transcript_2310/g.4274  ORF Transcript_2310/g.4274 Transcript_2310/m.4274 type:complete len:84 (-) Transcript_2310:2313-2564(-)